MAAIMKLATAAASGDISVPHATSRRRSDWFVNHNNYVALHGNLLARIHGRRRSISTDRIAMMVDNSVRQLIKQGADVNKLSPDGMTPLAVAAFWGYSEIVDELLRSGADVNSSNKGTLWTPLHCASFQGHGKVVMKLMECEPDLYTTDNQGRTAIDFASALDSIWPFFHAAGCKRTPKSDLVRMDIIKKVTSVDPTMPANEYIRFQSSRPGSAYVMNTQSLTQYNDRKMAYASVTGDVLAGTPDDARLGRRVQGSVWHN